MENNHINIRDIINNHININDPATQNKLKTQRLINSMILTFCIFVPLANAIIMFSNIMWPTPNDDSVILIIRTSILITIALGVYALKGGWPATLYECDAYTINKYSAVSDYYTITHIE